MKKLVVVGLLALGALYVARRTNLPSYVSTLWAKGQACVKNQVPRQFEIDRVRNEVQKLDADVRALLGPIAEKQAAINRLEREVKTARANLKTRRESLLALTQKVDAGTEQVAYNGEDLTLDEAKARLTHEFAMFKATDGSLKSREKLLAAQKQNVRYATEQLSKISDQKHEFEVRLAQLEATEEHLTLQQIASPLRVDQTRVADIKNTLDVIQQGQEVEAIKRQLEETFGTKTNGPGGRPAAPTVNTQEVRSFLGVPSTTTSAPKVVTK